MAAVATGTDSVQSLSGLQGLTLESVPVQPTSSNKSSSSDPASSNNSGSGAGLDMGLNMPLFVQQENVEDLDDDDDEEGGRKGKKGQPNPGRRKIEIEYIEDKSKRHITFSKRKAGIMKKAYELSTLTGTQVLLLVVSETGLVYTYTTNKLQPLVTAKEGKALIQACLTAEDGEPPFGDKADMPATPTTRTRADHRKVSMQVRLGGGNSNRNNDNGHDLHHGNLTPRAEMPPLSPGYQASLHHQQQAASQLMQPPYVTQHQQHQGLQGSLMPPSPMYNTQNGMVSMPNMNIPPMPSPASTVQDSVTSPRGLKKRKTVDNLRGDHDNGSSLDLMSNALQMAQHCLDQARANPTIGNLLRAFQQQDIAGRTKPPKINHDGSAAPEPLDSTIQLLQMSCENSAAGPEADQARLRGERWIDNVGVGHLLEAYDDFLHDFQVNKIIRPAKDVKASAKDLHNFADFLFSNSFLPAELHSELVKCCSSSSRVVKKKGSGANLATNGAMPNGVVQATAAVHAARAESAGKTLIDFCEFTRSHYSGLSTEQGAITLNGYFVVDRIRSSFSILRGIPIDGDPTANTDTGPFKVRMPRQLTAELHVRDQFLLSLARYPHLNHWVPTACGDVHPSMDGDMGEDELNPTLHQFEAEKAQRVQDHNAFSYHASEYQFQTKVLELLNEGELPEDGFGGVSVQQVLHGHASQQNLNTMAVNNQTNGLPQQQTNHRPIRRQPPRSTTNSSWNGDY